MWFHLVGRVETWCDYDNDEDDEKDHDKDYDKDQDKDYDHHLLDHLGNLHLDLVLSPGFGVRL